MTNFIRKSISDKGDASVKRHAKAPSAIAAARTGSTRTRKTLLGLACLCVLGLAAFAGSGAPAAGADETLPGQGFLPDSRSWELVSPPNKNGGNVSADPLRVRSAPDGTAVQFASFAPFADAIGASVLTDYVARRTAEPGTQGWATHAVTPEQEPFSLSDPITVQVEPKYEGEFSSDFNKAVFFSKSPVPLGSSPNVGNFQLLYRRNDLLTPGAGHYSLLSECAIPPAGPCATPPVPDVHPFRMVRFADASSDFGSVIFESRLALTNDAPDNSMPKLYLSEGGLPRLVGILPNAACATPPCPAESSAAGRGAGTEGGAVASYTMGTITEDGSRAIFTSPVDPNSQGLPGGGPTASNLYLRDDHGTPSVADDTTVPISADGNPPGVPSEQPAKFWASSSGVDEHGDRAPLEVFFTTGGGLYRWDEAAPAGSRLTLISVDTEPDDGTGGVPGAIGSSESGDYVYFVANNQLVNDGVPGSTEGTCDGETFCIFVWHDEGGGDSSIRQVATIGDVNEATWTIGAVVPIVFGETKTARVTPDGTHLLFASAHGSKLDAEAGIPGYDHGECDAADLRPWNPGGGHCAETYVYDATANSGAGQLRCASCNLSGIHATPYDSVFFQREATAADETLYLNHPISDNGRFVFFSTAEPLVPEDTNGRVDTYEFDETTGQQYLISSGESSAHSLFLNASSDGRSVFFTTRQRLTGWDVDEQQDLYVARINGGIADPPPLPPPCEGDACQPPPAILNDPTPASSSLSGPGNAEERSMTRRCPKGKRRATLHGKARCIKKPTKHKRRASK